MHDIRAIRHDPEAFDAACQRRGLPPVAKDLLELDKAWRAAKTRKETLLSERNTQTKQVGRLLQEGYAPDEAVQQLRTIRDQIAKLDAEEEHLAEALKRKLEVLPNLPAPDVPEGQDETQNQLVRTKGERPRFDFQPRQHFELGEGLRMMHFERAAHLAGARFSLLSGPLARLERALANFMLDIHTHRFGYREIAPPVLVRPEALYGAGQLPKFDKDLFVTTEDRWLIPTAEVPLTNLVAGCVLDAEALPLRLTAWTPCFRSEAGAAGKDTRGMIRLHQFSKVELVSITHPSASEAELERMTACAETILSELGLAFRTVVLCTGDMGFAARKTYDIEVWLPGQNAYREISSCSNCWDFQARRMQARFRTKDATHNNTQRDTHNNTPGNTNRGKTDWVHSLNGSGLAVGRCMVALLENFQQADGTVRLPSVLWPYMGGLEVLTPQTPLYDSL